MQNLIRSTFSGAFKLSCNPYSRAVAPRAALFKVSQPYSTVRFKARLPNFSTPQSLGKSNPLRLGAWVGAGTVAAVGLHLSLMPKLRFEPGSPAMTTTATAPVTPAATSPSEPVPATPPTSGLDVYNLSFGTVCGICAGVFVKKGAKAFAFFLGGIFVMLQYFTSINILDMKWGKLSSRFEGTFYSTPAAPGEAPRPPTVLALWNWMVDFLTADFPPRATFLAGFVLGLRLG
ncbi:hypothetical protein FRB95_005513 [Tulasnella sp. JGI-2019a]|nr:hypothetical protein FRB93_000595 [Tulasnella sp. JGI-2019a]KAG9029291.1 hypothetical protein FRB95_005513 [Tulasnella sp. JGI-2019a]